MNKKKKGVTLTELIMALGFVSVIMATAFFFFSSNNRKINEINVRTNLQAQAEICMKYISKSAMEASGGRYGENDLSGDSEIAFDTISEDGTKYTDGIIFVFRKSSKDIVMKVSNDGTSYNEKVICSNVEKFSATSKENEKNIIGISLLLSDKGINYSIEDSYLYRNGHLN